MEKEKLSYEQLEQLVSQYYQNNQTLLQKGEQLQQALQQANSNSINEALFSAIEIAKMPDSSPKSVGTKERAVKLIDFIFSRMEAAVYAALSPQEEEEEKNIDIPQEESKVVSINKNK